jgi:hypothetical protein
MQCSLPYDNIYEVEGCTCCNNDFIIPIVPVMKEQEYCSCWEYHKTGVIGENY